ncbi:unnamed protein product [Didymodactylos carnosus]|nr:unnamed protein product [Didymodactylos carnosus]CAF4071044.1 unnamed protein product [Didymodactylos carnosus]
MTIFPRLYFRITLAQGDPPLSSDWNHLGFTCNKQNLCNTRQQIEKTVKLANDFYPWELIEKNSTTTTMTTTTTTIITTTTATAITTATTATAITTATRTTAGAITTTINNAGSRDQQTILSTIHGILFLYCIVIVFRNFS